MKFTIIIATAFCLMINSTNAQINWVNYNTSNSLIPSDAVTKIIEDNNGNIWASTYGGLAMFDGVNWIAWDTTNNGTSLSDLYGMAYDKVNNYIWVTSPNSKLHRYDGSNWLSWYFAPYALDMTIDSSGNIWQAHYNGGISKFDGTTFTFYDTSNSPLPNNLVWTIDASPTNEIWVTSSYGLSRFDGNNWAIFDSINTPLISNYTTAVTFDGNGLTWVHGGSNGLTYLLNFDGTTWNEFDTAICMPPGGYCDIEIDQFNRKWIGSLGEGLSVLGDTSCAHFTIANSQIPSEAILDVYISSNNVLWLATYWNGVIRLDLPVGIPETLSDTQISIYPNPVRDITTVDMTHARIEKIVIVNSMGQTINQFDNIHKNSFDINLQKCESGIYFMHVTTENGQLKIVKLIKI